jgi:hypothetical protein
MCDKIEVGLTEMKVGKTKHYLCYPCMAEFVNDVLEFATMNLTKNTGDFGKIYFTDGEESEEK